MHASLSSHSSLPLSLFEMAACFEGRPSVRPSVRAAATSPLSCSLSCSHSLSLSFACHVKTEETGGRAGAGGRRETMCTLCRTSKACHFYPQEEFRERFLCCVRWSWRNIRKTRFQSYLFPRVEVKRVTPISAIDRHV